jgi:hypothetical protein
LYVIGCVPFVLSEKYLSALTRDTKSPFRNKSDKS